MTDLLDFITARLAEDEATARSATPGPWRTTPNRSVVTDTEAPRRIVASVAALELWPTHEDAAHMARHDPARVLRDVEANRLLLALHRPSAGACPTCCGEAAMDVTYDAESGEEAVSWRREDQPAPCPTLRLLALPYIDHPDYREEWAA